MNREIKFRAWNKKEEYMEIVDDLQMFSNDLSIGIPSKDYFLRKDDVELMQYTGLHDKNGKEIYEGDIVKVTYKNETEIFEVRYDEENTCFRMYYEDLKFLDFAIEEVDLYEVIGNIYDNPELLGEK